MTANPLPPLTPEQYEALKASIGARGVLVPAVVSAGPACEGEVGDGHHRIQACGELGIECPVERRPFASEAEFRLYQLDCNLQRRHLSIAQRIELGMAREPWERQLARARQAHGQTGPGRNASGSPTGSESRERTAAAVGLKPSTYERGAKVLREAPPELAEKLRQGETTVNRAYLELRNQQQRDEARTKADRLPDPAPPDGTYRCIVIDPPWPMAKITREQRPDQGEQLDYPTMTLDEIRTLTVADLVDPAGCHVYLWVTHKFLPSGLELLGVWGARYECSLTWVKPTGITPYSWMYNTEHCLFARAGQGLDLARMGRKLSFQAPAGRHSEKPDEFYDLVSECSPGPRLELFSRRPRPGFVAWGNEAEGAA